MKLCEHNIGNNRVLREYENYAGIIGTHAQILNDDVIWTLYSAHFIT